jgi:hypothetical protein
VCTYEGFPLVALPGANVFFTDQDVSSVERGISCKRIDATRALYDVVKAARYLVRLVDL